MPTPNDDDPLKDPVGRKIIRLVLSGVFVAARLCAGAIASPPELVDRAVQTADLLLEKIGAGT